MRLKLSLAVFALGALIAFWPVPRVDLSPIQRPLRVPAAAPTETAVPLERPSRPAHPSSIYMPKTLRRL